MNVQEIKEKCCGCSGCYHICPVSAITMEKDEEGFEYPKINSEKCIHCNLCKKVCTFNNEYTVKLNVNKNSFAQEYYACIAKDENVRMRSRSGAAFYLIAKKILQNGGIVYGIALNKQLQATLQRVDRYEDLYRLQGSKYVQANMLQGFYTVEKDLEEGKDVFFAATACEVAGLLGYLNEKKCDTKRLLTADIVCHGVPSPKIWMNNIRELENKWKMHITEVDFRDKNLGWKTHIESYRGIYRNGKISRKKYSNKYTSLFYESIALRPACHACVFCNFDRPADITLGDFWGASLSKLAQDTANGISQIMVNSLRGKEMLKEVPGALLYEVSREAVSMQPNLFHPTKVSPERKKFWALYNRKGYKIASKKYHRFIEKIKVPYNRIKCVILQRRFL